MRTAFVLAYGSIAIGSVAGCGDSAVTASNPEARPPHGSYSAVQVDRAFRSAGIPMIRLRLPGAGFLGLRPANARRDGTLGVLVFSSTVKARAWELSHASGDTPFRIRMLRRRNVVVREETLSRPQSARLTIALKALPP